MMFRKFLLILSGLLILAAVPAALGQEDEGIPIFTTATDSVGIGTYVAAEAYGVPAGEDPAEEPAVAIILPYGIHPNMHVMSIEEFEQPEPAVEGFTFEWSLAVPEGSSAELLADGTVAIFLADVGGDYDLTLSVTDPDGNAAETTWTVHATTYVGVGGIAEEPDMPQCAVCHIGQTEAWWQTGHAMLFAEAIDGQASDHYGESCIWCHTTGYNDLPTAVNGGFDDVAEEAGWTFPEVLEEGNWEEMKAEYPEVAGMALIQCESCHGPGADHFAGDPTEMGPIGLGLAYGTCAQCHAEEPYHIYPQQWETSAHAETNARAFTYPIGQDHASCVHCHSGAGFIDFANGVPEEQRRTDYQVITCAVCHDPHDISNPNQLRVFDMAMLPDGTEVTEAGAAATCMTCHNARRDSVASVEGERFRTPHYSTAAELMYGVGGYTWGEELPSGLHGMLVENTCIGCHMAPTPGEDEEGNPLPGRHEIGGHTFAMISEEGVENLAACESCHQGIETFDLEASGDYDGDGTVEVASAEIEGLRGLLEEAIVGAGVEVLDHYPYFNLPEDAGTDVKGSIWNLKFSESGGSAAHNFAYTVSLLQLSYEKLAGEPVPNAEILD